MGMPQIRTATPSERDRTIRALVLGFAADPLLRWFYPDAATYLATCIEGFDAFGGRAFEAGSAYVANDLQGGALWLPPGTEPDSERLGRTMVAAIAPEILHDVLGVFAAMAEYHPHEPVWYLPIIAVDPVFQGRGIGSALMKHALRRFDDEGIPAYLESSNPRNVSLYERHGFEATGRIQVGASPVVLPMIRRPGGRTA